MSVLPKIQVVATGGTIATRFDPDTGQVVPELTADELLQAVPQLEGRLAVGAETLFNIPSSSMDFAHVGRLALRLRELFRTSNPDGIVVTHGTDLLEETAWLLYLLLDVERPVILTGAMRNASLPGQDGPMNLFDAALLASRPESAPYRVLVAFNGRAYSPAEVTKVDTSSVDAFAAPGRGPVAVIEEDRVRYLRGPAEALAPFPRFPEALKPGGSLDLVPVALVKVAMGDDGSLARLALGAGSRGLVLEALGGGHLPPSYRPIISDAVRQGVPVVVTPRVLNGPVLRGTYTFPGSEVDLAGLGAILTSLRGPKARLFLSLALGRGASPDEIRRWFGAAETGLSGGVGAP